MVFFVCLVGFFEGVFFHEQTYNCDESTGGCNQSPATVNDQCFGQDDLV